MVYRTLPTVHYAVTEEWVLRGGVKIFYKSFKAVKTKVGISKNARVEDILMREEDNLRRAVDNLRGVGYILRRAANRREELDILWFDCRTHPFVFA